LNTWGTQSSTPNLQSSSQVQWATNAGATFFLTGVQFEKGSTASSFEYRPYGMDLSLCQRYYQRGGAYVYAYRTYSGNWQEYVWVSFNTTMRSNPTITLTNISATLTNAGYTLANRENGFAYGSNITGNGTYSREDAWAADIEL
jgi:hypothetical protein